MATLKLERMRLEDIEDVKLRDWEAEEYRGDHKAALEKMFHLSEEAISARVDGKLGLLFGHYPRSIYRGSGIVWMCATPVAEDNWVRFVRLSKHVVSVLGMTYPEVFTATYPGNARAIRFLTWLGFKEHSRLNNTLTMVRG